MAGERGEHGLDVLHRVVRVRRDAQTAGPRGGDDAVGLEGSDEGVLVRRGNGDEGAAPLRVARRRDAPAELVDVADTVTEMRSIKHAYDRGIRALRGIDY